MKCLKKEKVATAAVPVQKNEEAAVSKKPVSANAPVSEALVQAADTTANPPAETVKPAAKKMVKKTDKPVAKPLLPPVVVESDNGELPAEVASEVMEEPVVVETPAAPVSTIAPVQCPVLPQLCNTIINVSSCTASTIFLIKVEE